MLSDEYLSINKMMEMPQFEDKFKDMGYILLRYHLFKEDSPKPEKIGRNYFWKKSDIEEWQPNRRKK